MIAIREIIGLVALNFGLTPHELLSENRHQNVVLARHVAIYLARTQTSFSTVEIGQAFRGRDHSSIKYAISKIETELAAAPHGQLASLIRAIATNLDFRQRIEALGGIDVLSVARRIGAQPVHRSMGASVMEVAALAATVIDLWEIALAAEDLAEAVIDDRADERAAAIARSIVEELAMMRGTDTDKQETEDGNAD